MKISVIIPVHNAEAYLRECLDSVLSQQFAGELEVIAVDDGSTDGSADILRRYEHRVRILCQDCRGVSAARNRALEAATGDVLAMVDADDVLLPGALALLSAMMEQTGADMAMGRMIHGSDVSKAPVMASVPEKLRVISGSGASIEVLYQTLDNSPCAKLYRRELFDGVRFPSGRYEDLAIFPTLCRKAQKVAVADNVVYFYRTNPTSFINTLTRSRLDVLKVTRDLEKDADGAELLKAAQHRRFSACCNMAGLLTAHPEALPEERKTALEECVRDIRRLRTSVLFDRYSRMRNRGAALLSWLPRKWFLSLLSKYHS